MNFSEPLLSLLTCPESGLPLKIKGSQLVTIDGKIHYPIIEGIPWVFKNPLHSMVDWSVKLNHFNQVFTAEIQDLKKQKEKAPDYTQQRLEDLITGKAEFQKTVTELVSPILKAKVSSKPIYDALSDRAPSTQNLLSYEANLYRDWVWGYEENQLTCEIIKNITSHLNIELLLVLGAGSCRLAYDLHNTFSPKQTVANDINPLLLFSVNRLLHGEDLNIVEFPSHPRNINDTVVNHFIKSVEKPKNFDLLFSDAATPALKEKSFDLVVTPWLIDIQPIELGEFLKSINHYLSIGGYWVNFGSLVFNQARESYCYSVEEIKSIALKSGFEIETLSEHEIPYLKSPYNAGYRMERIWSWRAKKILDVKTSYQHQNLPEWILDTSKTIPLSQSIKSFAFNHKIYADLASKIDGQSSINRIARKVARQNAMDEQEAIAMVKNFYLKIVQ